ncbi:MAG: ABC transporter permease [Flavobacteriales bacterium]|nr:ABC transporter permease [Flavobacteriales bacterium]
MQLRRDISALLLLFVMPLAMVCIVTLIQKSAFDQMAALNLRIGVADCDNDTLGGLLKVHLGRVSGLQPEFHQFGSCDSAYQYARSATTHGDRQAVILIPHGLSQKFIRATENKIQQLMTPDTTENPDESPRLEIAFDPEVSGAVRLALYQSLEHSAQAMGAAFLAGYLRTQLLPKGAEPLQHIEFFNPLGIQEIQTTSTVSTHLTAATHNIPAWTVFALFFIVVPMATGMVRERDMGLRLRLQTLPPPVWLFDVARIAVYSAVCGLQALVIFLAGWQLFPHLGLGNLEMPSDMIPWVISLICIAFAATSYGHFVGRIAHTHEQAAAFGSLSVVILAALGGLWVPQFVLPEFLQKISAMSPLHWALQSLYEGLLRGGKWAHVWPYWLRLCVFGLLLIGLGSMKISFRSSSKPHSATSFE